MIETSATPAQVWEMWEKSHAKHGQKNLEKGQKGKSTFRYKVLDVKEGESFSILWKALFVRLVFSHKVVPSSRGSQIYYKVQIKGLFAWPVRMLAGEKIRKNTSLVLKSLVYQLENH